jgi:hypothetical protein
MNWRPKAFRVGTRLWTGSKRWRFFEGQLRDDVTKAVLTAEVSPSLSPGGLEPEIRLFSAEYNRLHRGGLFRVR